MCKILDFLFKKKENNTDIVIENTNSQPEIETYPTIEIEEEEGVEIDTETIIQTNNTEQPIMEAKTYFTIAELVYSDTAIKKGIDNSLPEEYMGNATRLIDMLNIIREAYGSPILVSSGYRCLKLNAAVGGVNTSQHCTCSAADIIPKDGDTLRLWNVVLKLIQEGKIVCGQAIWEKGTKQKPKWVHISLPFGKEGRKDNEILFIY